MKNIEEVYCLIDNLVKFIDAKKSSATPGRKGMLSKSEYITLAIFKQECGLKTTKQLYDFVKKYVREDFSPLPSYQQFNHNMKLTFQYFVLIVHLLTKITRKKDSKYHIVDSTPIPVCNNQYRNAAKLFRGLARSGKNINGWFWGFKLHIIINHNMEIEAVKISDGSMRDLDALNGAFIQDIAGWLIGDKGYIGKSKSEELAKNKIYLITKPRKNMKKVPALPIHSRLLSKRQTVESVFSYLKHRLSAVNQYARSAEGFFVNLFASVVSYIFYCERKISLCSSDFYHLLIS